MRIFGYARASTDKQAITLKDQREKIERAAAYVIDKHPGAVYIKTYEDPAVSGKQDWRKRPAGDALFFECEPGDLIIAAVFDRAFRSVVDLCNTVELLKFKEVNLKLLDMEFDTSTPIGMACLQMLAVIKEFELKTTSERTKAALAYKRKHNLPVGFYPPIGWQRAGVKDKSRYVPCGMDRRWCKEIVRLWESGIGCRKVHAELRRRGARTHMGTTYTELRTRKGYVACKLGFPLLTMKELPRVADINRWLAERDLQQLSLPPAEVCAGPSLPSHEVRVPYRPSLQPRVEECREQGQAHGGTA